MKKGIYLLPNIITLCGMTCGFYSILSSLKGNFEHAAWAILIANIFDALDGWVARLTNSASKFGVQLDSLSDLLTFCAASAILVYSWKISALGRPGWAIALFFVLCGALRLARYNVQADSLESKNFTGMPTPGAATILASCALVCDTDFPGLKYIVLGLTALLGVLMVSTIRYRSAKEILMRKRKPFWALVLFAAFVILVIFNPPVVIFVSSTSYMLWGLGEELFRRMRRQSGQTKTAGGSGNVIALVTPASPAESNRRPPRAAP